MNQQNKIILLILASAVTAYLLFKKKVDKAGEEVQKKINRVLIGVLIFVLGLLLAPLFPAGMIFAIKGLCLAVGGLYATGYLGTQTEQIANETANVTNPSTTVDPKSTYDALSNGSLFFSYYAKLKPDDKSYLTTQKISTEAVYLDVQKVAVEQYKEIFGKDPNLKDLLDPKGDTSVGLMWVTGEQQTFNKKVLEVWKSKNNPIEVPK